MKNSLSKTLLILALVVSTLGCYGLIAGTGQTVRGSGNVIDETRAVSKVSGVELAMPGTLHITRGDSESLRIEAQENLMEYIETNVSGGRLVIKSRQNSDLEPTRPINYYLTVKELSSIEISSSGSIESGDLQSDSFSIMIGSSGDLDIAGLECATLDVQISSSGNTVLSSLTADSISVDISSSGNLDIKQGQVQKQDIKISSSGEYRARDLKSVLAHVILTSSGEATIRVSDRLTGSLSSSGNINYIGNPDVNVSMTSSGRTVHVGD